MVFFIHCKVAINNNNNKLSGFYSAFLNTQRRFTNKKGIHTDSTDNQTKGEKNKQQPTGNTLRERERVEDGGG